MGKLLGVCIVGAAVFLGAVVVEIARMGAKQGAHVHPQPSTTTNTTKA